MAITEGMTEPTCAKCGHGIDAHGSFGCLDCSHESICVEQASAIYRHALAEKTAEVERLKCLHSDAWEEIAKLRRALAEAQADSARLDLVQTRGLDIAPPMPDVDYDWDVRDHGTDEMFSGKTLREAIDAARKCTPEPASRQPDPAPGGTEND